MGFSAVGFAGALRLRGLGAWGVVVVTDRQKKQTQQ